MDIEEEDDNQSSSELPKRTKSNSGILTWSLGDDPETGVHIYPPDPTPVRSRCDEVCSWRGYGYSGSAYSCTLREWAGMEKEGLTVRSIIRGTMGSEVHDQVDEEVNRMLPV